MPNLRPLFQLTCVALLALQASVSHAADEVDEDRPNFLWITAEDMSATLGCYGDEFANTPNIDRLAAESSRYTLAFATAPVCSPSRSCLINGCIATTQGTHPMRSLSPIPAEMLGFPSYLRDLGYFTSNNVKTDYNTSSEEQIIAASWDSNGKTASWHQREESEPFFAVHNLMTSHQSRTMVWPYEQFLDEVANRLPNADRHAAEVVPLPPYYPDTPIVRRAMARYYDCVSVMDMEVGQLLQQLETDGLAENTIVFFYSDHGSGMPRHKRALFDSGTHVPLLVRFPPKYRHLAPGKPGETVDRLVSFEDFGPTMLSLANITSLPSFMRGKPFLGALNAKPRDYIFCHRDRVDEVLDMARSVRSKRFLYIRNFMPHRGYHQPSAWVDAGQLKEAFYELAESGNANPAQAQFLNSRRPTEELYDCVSDPLNLTNLAADPSYVEKLEHLRNVLRKEMLASQDLGLVPEIELRLQSTGTTPRQASEKGVFDLPRILRAAELVGREDLGSIEQNLHDSDPCVRYWAAVACHALEMLPIPLAEKLRERSEDPSPIVRIEVAAALASHLGEPGALQILVDHLGNDDETIVLHAARELEMLGDPSTKKDIESTAAKYAEAPGDVAWCIRFTTSAYLKRVQ